MSLIIGFTGLIGWLGSHVRKALESNSFSIVDLDIITRTLIERPKQQEINKLDFDVVSIECSRSGGEIIEAFENIDFKRQIGLGVWDIHSPAIPTKDDMVKILKRALRVIPRSQFWINPDCGLKTRGWEETKASMKNMVEARKSVI